MMGVVARGVRASGLLPIQSRLKPRDVGNAVGVTSSSIATCRLFPIQSQLQPCDVCNAMDVFQGSLASQQGVDCRGEVRVVPDGSGECVERSEEHTSELQSLMRISYAVFCLKKKK